MPRLLMTILLLCFAVSVVGCAGVGAAREAGESARGSAGGDDQPRQQPVANDPPAGETAAPGETAGAEGSGEEQAQETGGDSGASELALDPKWFKDSDGNHVPDFVEIENDGGRSGDDPFEDDCAPEQCPGGGEGVEFLTRERNALLILDSSGSMADDDGSGAGRTKMDAAKDAISRYSGVSAALFETGFAVYGHTGDSTEAGKQASCETAAETLAPIGAVEAEGFRQTLSRFQPTGWTPIEGALREAASAFAGKEGQENRVILVSDGIETCGGDPVAAAKELQASGIGVQVDVVGFGVPDDETTQLENIALAGGGEYFDAQTGADLDGYFRQQSEAIGQTWDAAACELRNGFHDSLCDYEQCQDATAFRIPDEQAKYDLDDPEYQALQELSDRIDAGLAEREEARDDAMNRSEELMAQHDKLREEYNRALQQAYES